MPVIRFTLQFFDCIVSVVWSKKFVVESVLEIFVIELYKESVLIIVKYNLEKQEEKSRKWQFLNKILLLKVCQCQHKDIY